MSSHVDTADGIDWEMLLEIVGIVLLGLAVVLGSAALV